MNDYIGVELIDPIERERQHTLIKALWQQFCELGIKSGDKGRISCILLSKSFEQANELRSIYKGDWKSNIFEQEENSLYIVEVITPLFCFNVEALIELSDVLMVSAYEYDSKFDGFEANIEEIKRINKPWWKLW